MVIAKILSDIPILLILTIFITSLVYTVRSYKDIYMSLQGLNKYLKEFDSKNISYKFEEFKVLMRASYLTADVWNEFKNTLIFSDLTPYKENDTMSTSNTEIKTTSKVEDYYNVETLAFNHYNKHIVSIMPTILTGFGPLFTFVLIGIAFGKLDFTSSQVLMKTISEFVGTMQLAAMCSVVAVASALIFMSIEKFGFSKYILPEVIKMQNKIATLFKPASEEQFLIDLLVAVKNQNVDSAVLLKNIPETFTKSIKKDITNMLIPYLDSILAGMNAVNTNIEKSINNDNIDDIFKE